MSYIDNIYEGVMGYFNYEDVLYEYDSIFNIVSADGRGSRVINTVGMMSGLKEILPTTCPQCKQKTLYLCLDSTFRCGKCDYTD